MKKTKLLTIGYKALQHQVLPHLPDHRPSGAHQVFSCLRAFALTGLAPWNISPLSLHRPGSFQTFRSQLEHYLLRKTFCDYPTFIRSSITGFFFHFICVTYNVFSHSFMLLSACHTNVSAPWEREPCLSCSCWTCCISQWAWHPRAYNKYVLDDK